MTEIIEQLELYLEPTEQNKKFKSLNDYDKNLVIELGLQMMKKGSKDIQLWKNKEWEKKLRETEENKNTIIKNLNDGIIKLIEKEKEKTVEHKSEIEEIKLEIKDKYKIIYSNQIEELNKKISQSNEKITDSTKKIEEERNKTWEIQESFHRKLNEEKIVVRKEKDELRDKYQNKMDEERKVYESQLEKEREKYLMINKRNDNSTLLGQDGEEFTFHILNRLFPKSEIIDTHTEKESGDFKLTYNNTPILLEVKNYSGNVLKKEIVKFRRDMECQAEMKGGVFISLKSGISAREDFAMEVSNKKPIIFLTYTKEDMKKIVLAVKIIETIVKENIDLTKEEICGGLKKLIPVIKRRWNTLKGTLENFNKKMNQDLLEQENNVVEFFKIIGMKY
jgi:Trp operon repressor